MENDMTNDRDKIKEKVKKLFALSKSSNAHEAAAALEMAQKLMEQYGLDYRDTYHGEIREDEVTGNSGPHPPEYEVYLAHSIARAFGCRCAYGYIPTNYKTPKYGHTFVGIEHRVTIASFISEVLLRKLKQARKDYLKTLYRMKNRKNKICRADEFCSGWVCEVVSKLKAFTREPEEDQALERYLKHLNRGTNLTTIQRQAVKGHEYDDWKKGREAAVYVQIQQGVEGQERGARLLSVR
jgi:hypothetical protein